MLALVLVFDWLGSYMDNMQHIESNINLLCAFLAELWFIILKSF